MSLHGYQEGYDVQDLVLLQTFLGLSIAFGIVISGSAINKVCQIAYRKINITRQHVCQVRVSFEMKMTISRVECLMKFHVRGKPDPSIDV